MEHFVFPNLGEDQKKGLHQKWNRFFRRIQAHQGQIIGEDADLDHTQTIGGIQPNYWGDTSPVPPGFGTPVP